MSKRFFTSDYHFGHANILKYQPNRKFDSCNEMNFGLAELWNTVVGEEDVVYCLGDMAFKSNILKMFMPGLNGTKILIVGNHDPMFRDLKRGGEGLKKAKELGLELGFSEVHRELFLEIDGIGPVKLCHFPYLPIKASGLEPFELRYSELRPKKEHEKLLLHGHVHSSWLSLLDRGPMINVGIDVWDLLPVSEEKIVELYRKF